MTTPFPTSFPPFPEDPLGPDSGDEAPPFDPFAPVDGAETTSSFATPTTVPSLTTAAPAPTRAPLTTAAARVPQTAVPPLTVPSQRPDLDPLVAPSEESATLSATVIVVIIMVSVIFAFAVGSFCLVRCRRRRDHKLLEKERRAEMERYTRASSHDGNKGLNSQASRLASEAGFSVEKGAYGSEVGSLSISSAAFSGLESQISGPSYVVPLNPPANYGLPDTRGLLGTSFVSSSKFAPSPAASYAYGSQTRYTFGRAGSKSGSSDIYAVELAGSKSGSSDIYAVELTGSKSGSSDIYAVERAGSKSGNAKSNSPFSSSGSRPPKKHILLGRTATRTFSARRTASTNSNLEGVENSRTNSNLEGVENSRIGSSRETNDASYDPYVSHQSESVENRRFYPSRETNNEAGNTHIYPSHHNEATFTGDEKGAGGNDENSRDRYSVHYESLGSSTDVSSSMDVDASSITSCTVASTSVDAPMSVKSGVDAPMSVKSVNSSADTPVYVKSSADSGGADSATRISKKSMEQREMLSKELDALDRGTRGDSGTGQRRKLSCRSQIERNIHSRNMYLGAMDDFAAEMHTVSEDEFYGGRGGRMAVEFDQDGHAVYVPMSS
ncbi:MAG: hypothetical protein SGCHY_003829 [Lobulomycetales sp.]